MDRETRTVSVPEEEAGGQSAAGSPLVRASNAPRRVRCRMRRVQMERDRQRRRGDSDECSDAVDDAGQLATSAGAERSHEPPSPPPCALGPVRLTGRQARWLNATPGTAMLCKPSGVAGDSARTAPRGQTKVADQRTRVLTRKGLRHCTYLQGEDESDDCQDPSWAGGGRSPDSLFTRSIHKYLQAQRSMQVTQKRARSACREMVCAVPHVPTAAASMRRGVKVKARDEQRTLARPSSASSAVSSPLGIHSQPLSAYFDPCHDPSCDGDKDVGACIDDGAGDGAGDGADLPDPDDWFPEGGAFAADCEEQEEWMEIPDSNLAEMTFGRGSSTASTTSDENRALGGLGGATEMRAGSGADPDVDEDVDEDGLIWVEAATLEESLDRSIAKGLSLKESVEEEARLRRQEARLRADRAAADRFENFSRSGAIKKETMPPRQQSRLRPGSVRARSGWDSPVGWLQAKSRAARDVSPGGPGGGAGWRQNLFDPSFQTQVRLRTAADCEADMEVLLQTARPGRSAGAEEATRARPQTSRPCAVAKCAGPEHVGPVVDDGRERSEPARKPPGVPATAGSATGRPASRELFASATWAHPRLRRCDRATPKLDDGKAQQRGCGAPGHAHSRSSWDHIQAPTSTLRLGAFTSAERTAPSLGPATSKRLLTTPEEANEARHPAFCSAAVDDWSGGREAQARHGDSCAPPPVEATVCTRGSPAQSPPLVSSDGIVSPLPAAEACAGTSTPGPGVPAPNTGLATALCASPGAETRLHGGRAACEFWLKGAEDDLSAASTPPLSSRRLARGAMLAPSIASFCNDEDSDAQIAAAGACFVRAGASVAGAGAGGSGRSVTGTGSADAREQAAGGRDRTSPLLEQLEHCDAESVAAERALSAASSPATPVLRHRRPAPSRPMSPISAAGHPAAAGGPAGRSRGDTKAVGAGGADKVERVKSAKGRKGKSLSQKAGVTAGPGQPPGVKQACVGSHKSLRQHISLYKVLGSDA